MDEITIRKNKIIRTSSLLLKLTPDQFKAANLTHDLVHKRANELAMVLLAMRCEEVSFYDSASGVTTVLNSAYFENWWKEKSSNFSIQHIPVLKELYTLILKASKRKGYLGPIKSANSKAGLEEQKDSAIKLMRMLLDEKVLPVTLQTKIPLSFDYAAWEMAASYVASWEECNQATVESYKNKKSKVDESQPDTTAFNCLRELIEKTGLNVTSKLVYKMGKYGFDVSYAKEELAVAKSLNPDVTFWAKLFEYTILATDLSQLRPNARFKSIDPNGHVRQISFGHNFVKFSIEQNNSNLLFSTKLCTSEDTTADFVLKASPSDYFRDLKLEEISGGSTYYKLHYRRGNQSSLNEDIIADLKETKLLKENGGFHFYLPVSFEITPNQEGVKLKEHFYGEPKGKFPKMPDGTRFITADHGVNPFWAIECFEILSGKKKSVAKKTLGEVRDHQYMKFIRVLEKDIEITSRLIDYTKYVNQVDHQLDYEKSDRNPIPPILHKKKEAYFKATCEMAQIEYPCNVGSAKLMADIEDKITAIKNQYKQLKRFDIYTSRQTGLSQEQFWWICLTKKMISLLKKFSYTGKPSIGRFEKRVGFEKWSSYFASLKKDLIKKFAQSLIYECRKFGAVAVMCESLTFDRSKARNKSQDNEFLSLWSQATIKQWIDHFAFQYGISVIEGDAKTTSQIDPDTQKWGYRSEENKKILWVDREGTMVKIDADLDAATGNLANQLMDRVENVYMMEARYVSNSEVLGFSAYVPHIPKEQSSDKSGKKWKNKLIVHHLKRKYKTISIAVDAQSGKIHKLAKKTYDSIDLIGKSVWLYRHGEKWLSKDEHRKVIEQLKAAAST